MRLKLLFTVGLLLCLSKFGSPNECSRCRKATQVMHASKAADNEYSTLLIPRLLYI